MNQLDGSVASPQKLPVWTTVTKSYSFVLQHIVPLARVGLIPMLAYGAIMFFWAKPLELEAMEMALRGEQPPLWYPFAAVVGMLPMLFFATAWHRYSIMRNPEDAGIFSLRFGKAELIFAGYIVLLYLMVIIVSLIGGIVGAFIGGPAGQGVIVVTIAAMLIVSFGLWTRLTLVFPACAIGAPAGLKDSWRATRGNMMRMIAITILVLIPQILLAVVVSLVINPNLFSLQPDTLAMSDTMVSTTIFEVVFYWLYTGINIGALSFMFKYLTEKDMGADVDMEAFD